MEIYCCTKTQSKPNIRESTLINQNVAGITFQVPIASFFGYNGIGYEDSYISYIKEEIKMIRSHGKKVTLAVVWGRYCGNVIYNEYPFVQLTEKHHQGEGDPVFMKVPVIYDGGFVLKVQEFYLWLSTKVVVDRIVIGGINQTTPELRIPDQDFTGVGDPYVNGALKWIAAQYTVDKVKEVLTEVIGFMNELYGNKCTLQVISALAGFPCINEKGICKPKERPDLSRYAAGLNTGALEWCYLDADNTPPDYVREYTGEKIYQIRNDKYGMLIVPPKGDDVLLVQNCKKWGGTVMEIFENTLMYYPNIKV